ncbi:MAG: C4-type zinc ribbon domain-containing protein [Clostridia bacterium]|nr:C4-type zinc ribbon domain-containing protein [Clostridia bacterium]
MQLYSLWQFMQVDMEADGFESRMRQSANRQKLIKQRDFLKDQQANMKKLESDVAVMQDRLEAVKDEAARLEKVLEALSQEINDNPPASVEEAQKQSEAVSKLLDSLSRYEHELQKMRKDADTKDRQQKEIRVRAAKTKVEFDQLKVEYDKEFKADTEKLQQMRANTEKEAKKIDPKLLAKYRSIKQHCTPPMAKLINGQCSGCFMSLPSATLLDIRSGEHIVECDNCGRILYDAGE